MTKQKKILTLLGHTDNHSFSGTFAYVYDEEARLAGHEVRRMNIGEMHFDPVLHNGYKSIQELEPDLLQFQGNVKWADHVVFVYPNWWCSMPAKLKGLFDRVWLPGFAFNFDKETKKLIPRLEGKTARVIVVAGTHSPLMTWFKFGDFTNEISRGILGFAGMEVKVSTFGPCEECSVGDREQWLEQAKGFGKVGI